MQRLIETADPDDPAIAVFRDIRERDLSRMGGFIAEGTVVLDSLVRSPFFRPERLLVLRNRVAGISQILSAVPEEVPIHVVDGPVLDRIAGFAMHRGVLAHGVPKSRPAATLAERLRDAASGGRSLVVAVGIANHDNIGGIFRNAAAFSAGMVLLDDRCCDPLYRKAIRVSAGAVLQLPYERVDPVALLPALRAAGLRPVALSPQGGADISSLERGGPAALFLGSEGPGLPKGLMDGMESLRIDMAPGFDSLNVATASAIALQRLYSARMSLPRA